MITMNQFGQWGRAGNQFFQYAFLTGYAQRHNTSLQIPRWVGTHLFGCSIPEVTTRLPRWLEPGSGLEHPTPPKGSELVGHDFHGYAQYHTSYYAEDKERIRNLFQPVGSVVVRMGPAMSHLHGLGETKIGIHLRRGDYGRNIFPIIPTSWYVAWLHRNWGRFENPVLFVATETTELVNDFSEFNPQTVETLGISLRDMPMADCTYLKRDLLYHDSRAMDWYPDFHLLSHCDVVLGPSSSFSFFAAMLNPSLQEYWRASLKTAWWQRTNPWDAYPMLREHVRDYPHLPGITAPDNPYF